MTTILGFRADGVSWLAADSRVCNGNPLPVTQKKIHQAGPWAIAPSGDLRMLNLIEENASRLAGCADIGQVCRLLRELVEADGWQKKQGSEGSSEWGAFTVMVASAEALWRVSCDFCYARVDDGHIVGCGSGHEYALGAFEVLDHSLKPGWAMRRAITVAARFDPGTDDRVLVWASDDQPARVDARDFGITEDGCIGGTTLPVMAPMAHRRA